MFSILEVGLRPKAVCHPSFSIPTAAHCREQAMLGNPENEDRYQMLNLLHQASSINERSRIGSSET